MRSEITESPRNIEVSFCAFRASARHALAIITVASAAHQKATEAKRSRAPIWIEPPPVRVRGLRIACYRVARTLRQMTDPAKAPITAPRIREDVGCRRMARRTVLSVL